MTEGVETIRENKCSPLQRIMEDQFCVIMDII